LYLNSGKRKDLSLGFRVSFSYYTTRETKLQVKGLLFAWQIAVRNGDFPIWLHFFALSAPFRAFLHEG